MAYAPYIESHTDLIHHDKFVKLLDILSVDVCCAKGMLVLLWEYLLVNAPDGVLPKTLRGSRLATVCGTSQVDGKRLLRALHTCGFLDKLDDTYVAHDWEANIGERYIKRKKEAERKRLSRLKSKNSVSADVRGCPREQNRTEQNRYISASAENQENQDTQDSQDSNDNIATPEYVKESIAKIKESLSHIGQRMRVDLSEGSNKGGENFQQAQTLEQRLQAAKEFCRQQGIEWKGGD